jgi:predicted O-methyltransferase YrrM
LKKLFAVSQYLRYWLHKVNEHSLHSPFLYKFYTEVIKNNNPAGFEKLEELRSSLLASDQSVAIEEMGAGSRVDNAPTRKVAHIARHAITRPPFSRLLFRIIREYNFTHILELGTSLGQNTLYMHQAAPEGTIYTLEGSPEIVQVAQQNFDNMGAGNIHIVEGNIDKTLLPTLNKMEKVDLAYVDANHRYEPTLRYFEAILAKTHARSIIVIDDLHWSKGMNDAWQQIVAHPRVSLTLDLFDAGLVFLNPELKKELCVLDF